MGYLYRILVTCVVDGDVTHYKLDQVNEEEVIRLSNRVAVYCIVDLDNGDVLHSNINGELVHHTPDTTYVEEVLTEIDGECEEENCNRLVDRYEKYCHHHR